MKSAALCDLIHRAVGGAKLLRCVFDPQFIAIPHRRGAKTLLEDVIQAGFADTAVRCQKGNIKVQFRVLLDVTEQRTPINQSVVETYINLFKSLRSVLENDEIIYRSRNTFAVGVSGAYVFFSARLCGTFPEAAVQGRIQQDVIAVSADGNSVGYTVPATGEIETGTFPITAVQGGIESGSISMEASVGSASYSSRMCGTPLGSLI